MRFLLRLTGGTLAGMLLLLTGLLALSRPHDTPDSAGWIAFVSRSLRGTSGTTVARMLPDGANVRPLVTDLPRADHLAWSAASNRLAFVSGGVRDLSVAHVRATGSDLRTLAAIAPGRIPSWTPDGQQVAFGDADGLVLTSLDRSPQSLALAPPDGFMAWSPDGRNVAYGVDGTLVRADIAQETFIPLTDDARRNFFPAWSPTGDWLAYISDVPNEAAIFRVRPDGSDRERLLSGLYLMGYPVWSPDGSHLAFVSYHVTRNGLYVLNVENGDVRRLPGNIYPYWFPAWSPDGRWLYVALQTGQHYNLYRIRSDGEAVQPLLDLPTDDIYPVWMSHPARPLRWLWLGSATLVLAGLLVTIRRTRPARLRLIIEE